MLPTLVICLKEKTQLSAKAISLRALARAHVLSLLILLLLPGNAVLAAEDTWMCHHGPVTSAWAHRGGQSRAKTVGEEVTCWDKMWEADSLNYLETSSELKERGQALWHDGKWAISVAALCFLLHFCFKSLLAVSSAERQRVRARTLLQVSR